MKRIRIYPLKSPVQASIAIPGSKSYTNRALLLAALTCGRVKIKNPLISEDTHAMISCLRELGMRCSFEEDSLEVSGNLQSIENREYNLSTFLSGTTARFMLALSAVIPGTQIIRGRGRLNERPMAHLVESLQQLGAKIEYLDKHGFPPVRVLSSKLTPGRITMNGTVSSQFLSALLMIAPLVGKIEIDVEGEQISRPYLDMTIEAMGKFGVHVKSEGYKRYVVPGGQKYKAEEYAVEGDVSSASYFAGIAALTHSTITLGNLNPESLQADMRFLKILEGMGNIITYKKNAITIHGMGVRSVTVDMQDCPDQAQTLAVLSAFAGGMTTITGIQSLRIKETERISAVKQELKKMGIQTESTSDSIIIYGGSPKGARIDTYGDHRMAMAFAVAGAAIDGMEINEPDVVSKTYPQFWESLASIGIKTEYSYEHPNIVLIGMRGGGKSTVAKHLSERLGKRLADLDAMIERDEGMSIPLTIEKFGWEYFRDREAEIVRKVARLKDAVVSTGGGVIGRPENIAALKQRGILIFLSSSAKILAERILNDEGRPRLTESATTLEEVESVLAERKKLYETVADEIIDDTELHLDAKVEEVMRRLQIRGIVKK